MSKFRIWLIQSYYDSDTKEAMQEYEVMIDVQPKSREDRQSVLLKAISFGDLLAQLDKLDIKAIPTSDGRMIP